MWDEIIEAVDRELPRFNDYLLKGYRKDQVANMAEFVSHVYDESAKLFGGKLIYRGYSCLNPEQRIQYSVSNSSNTIKGRYNIQHNELSLYEYIFEYEGVRYPVQIYLPYLHNGSLQINDTKYYIQHCIIERTIYRITDGIIIKVMRSPIQFWRTEQLGYTDTKGNTYMDAIITTKVHFGKNKSSSRKNRTPLILYLLCKYGLEEILTNILGLYPEAVSFVGEPDDDPDYTYFECNKHVYIKVDTEVVMKDTSFRRFVASLLYICKMAKRFTLSDTYSPVFYKIILGKSLHSATAKDGLAISHTVSHMSSLDTYLDYYTKQDLKELGLHCNDIYDVFTAVFFNIDSWLINYSPNDLFDKRIGGVDLILMDLVKSTFTRFYNTLRKKTITHSDITSMLKMDSMRISSIYRIPSVKSAAAMYNGNMLLATYIKMQRQTSSQDNGSSSNRNILHSKDHQFHISFPAITSVLAVSHSSPGSSGDINPFAAIDSRGNFLKAEMPWVDELSTLNNYLPHA